MVADVQNVLVSSIWPWTWNSRFSFVTFFSLNFHVPPRHTWYHMFNQKVLTFLFSTFAPRITRTDIHNRGDRRGPCPRWRYGPFGTAQGTDTPSNAKEGKQCVELPLTTKQIVTFDRCSNQVKIPKCQYIFRKFRILKFLKISKF